METIGQRITRLRNAKDWSRPELGRHMATAIGKDKPFSGEAIRRYENDIDRPGRAALAALTKVFNRDGAFIEYGVVRERTGINEPAATYAVPLRNEGDTLLAIVRAFLETDAEGKDVMAKTIAKIAEARALHATGKSGSPKHERRHRRR